ncbi:hypothetical protein FPQ18DRAFT_423967 [Pyronema domesticum]|nr:hypothetical protein FPQ18DRAFT_423967 [Pyronema domesticum]
MVEVKKIKKWVALDLSTDKNGSTPEYKTRSAGISLVPGLGLRAISGNTLFAHNEQAHRSKNMADPQKGKESPGEPSQKKMGSRKNYAEERESLADPSHLFKGSSLRRAPTFPPHPTTHEVAASTFSSSTAATTRVPFSSPIDLSAINLSSSVTNTSSHTSLRQTSTLLPELLNAQPSSKLGRESYELQHCLDLPDITKSRTVVNPHQTESINLTVSNTHTPIRRLRSSSIRQRPESLRSFEEVEAIRSDTSTSPQPRLFTLHPPLTTPRSELISSTPATKNEKGKLLVKSSLTRFQSPSYTVTVPFWKASRKVHNQITSIDQFTFNTMPASSVTNADDNTDGALTTSGSGRLTEVLSAAQVMDSAIANGVVTTTVKWDGTNPEDFVRVLEGCGQSPTLLDDRRRGRVSTPGLRFDVVLVSLKNTGGSNIRGLPMHVMLGRPAFVVFDTIGSVEAIAQAHALMEAWGLRKLESIYHLPTTADGTTQNSNTFGALFQSQFSGGMIAVRGLINRSVDVDLIHACVHGDLSISEVDRGLKVFVEGFIRGQRRLHLFAKAEDVSPGWIHVGPTLQTNFDCRTYIEADISVLARLPEILSIRPQTPTRGTPTAPVPPSASPHHIAEENTLPILVPTPIRASAAATFLNNVQTDGELVVPEIVLERTPTPSQDNVRTLPPTPAPSAGTVQLSLAVPVTRRRARSVSATFEKDVQPTLRRTVSYESGMRNAQPLPRLEIPVVVPVVFVPSTTTDAGLEVGEDDYFGLERRETASGSEPESPEEDIEDVIVPRIALLDIGAEEAEMAQQAPEATTAEPDLTPNVPAPRPNQVVRLEETDIAEFLRYRRPTPVNRTPAEILQGPADQGERERVIPTESPLPHWEVPERETSLLAVPGNVGVAHLRARPESPAGFSQDHLQARDALTMAVQRTRSASTSPGAPNAGALVKRSSSTTPDDRRSVSPFSPRTRSLGGLRRL